MWSNMGVKHGHLLWTRTSNTFTSVVVIRQEINNIRKLFSTKHTHMGGGGGFRGSKSFRIPDKKKIQVFVLSSVPSVVFQQLGLGPDSSLARSAFVASDIRS
jgi:hypothetical protein